MQAVYYHVISFWIFREIVYAHHIDCIWLNDLHEQERACKCCVGALLWGCSLLCKLCFCITCFDNRLGESVSRKEITSLTLRRHLPFGTRLAWRYIQSIKAMLHLVNGIGNTFRNMGIPSPQLRE